MIDVQLSQIGFLEGPDISLGGRGRSSTRGSPQYFPPAQIPPFCPLCELGQHYPPGGPVGAQWVFRELSSLGRRTSLSPSRFLVAHRAPKRIEWEVVVGERALQGARMRQLPDNAHELGGNNGQCRATPRTRSHRGTCTALRLPLGSVDSCPLNHLVGGTNPFGSTLLQAL